MAFIWKRDPLPSELAFFAHARLGLRFGMDKAKRMIDKTKALVR